MNSSLKVDEIARFLEKRDNIAFALLFGSSVKGKITNLSDVDIGIYTETDISLLEMGRIVAGLEKIVKKKVDLVVLNDLFKQKPNFAFQVVSNSTLLFTKEQNVFINFKKHVFLYYLDVKPLLDKMNMSLERRLNTNQFGERNYA